MRIILVEDNKAKSDSVLECVTQMGHVVDSAFSSDEAIIAIDCIGYDLIILDLHSPQETGILILDHLRNKGITTAVIVLTSADDLEVRIKTLDAGADDVLLKPFDFKELEARIRAVIRRNFQITPKIKIGKLTYDQISRIALIDDDEIFLSAREQTILEALLLSGERMITKDQLLEKICSWDREVSINAIEVYIHRLRKKLQNANVSINTSRGLGYNIRPRNH